VDHLISVNYSLVIRGGEDPRSKDRSDQTNKSMASVDDAPLRDVLRALISEVEKLSGRISFLEADNRLLRFELAHCAGAIDTSMSQGIGARRVTFQAELDLPRDHAVVSEHARQPVADRLADVEDRVLSLEGSASRSSMHPSERADYDKGAALSYRCLSCQNPAASGGRSPSPVDERMAHGRPGPFHVRKTPSGDGRPTSAPLGSIRLDADRVAPPPSHITAPQARPHTGGDMTLHVGRRAAAYGVEKIRPRSRQPPGHGGVT